MIAQLDEAFWRASRTRSAVRLASYLLFEGRPTTTHGQAINPLVLAHLRFATRLPMRDRVDRPIFILGMGRSGTTVLGRVLGTHPHVGFLNEPKAIWHVVHPGEDIIGTYATTAGRLRLGAADADAGARSRARRIVSWYLATTRSRRLVDKYPELVFRTGFVRALFPDAIFLVITRAPWAAISSVGAWSDEHADADADWWGVNDRKWRVLWDEGVLGDPANEDLAALDLGGAQDQHTRAAVEWAVTNRTALALRDADDPSTHVVAYEALTEDPEGMTARLLEHCGLPHDERVTAFAREVLRPAREGEAPDSISPDLVAAIERTARAPVPVTMRILLVNKFWRPVGGVEEHCFAVKQAFEARGHEVIPFSMADEDNLASPASAFFPSKVEFRGGPARDRLRAAGRAVFGVETLRCLRRLLDDQPVDAVHVVHAYHQLGTTFLRMLRSRGIPTVLSLHDYKLGCPSYRLFSDATGEICTICLDRPNAYLWAPTATRCWDTSRTGGLMLTAEATVARAVGAYSKGPTAVIVLNDLQRRAVLRAGVPERRIHIVRHAVDVDPAPPTERAPHALYVGRLVIEKGVEDAIDACAEVGLPLRVVGEGRLREDLERRARERGADIVFTGQIPQEQVLAEMHSARLLVVPSRWHEVLALVITQAIAAHLPVVATDAGGNPDLLGEGRGFLYPPADVAGLAAILRRLVDQPELGHDAAAQAATWARTELTEAKWVDRMRAVYATAGVAL